MVHWFRFAFSLSRNDCRYDSAGRYSTAESLPQLESNYTDLPTYST